MKVLLVTGEFPPMQGGVGDYTREIGLALRDLGCEVQVVTSMLADQVAGLGVHASVPRWNWSCWRTVLDIVRREQPDVIHVQYQAAAYAMHPAINFLPWRVQRLGIGRPWTAVTFHDLKVPYLFPKAGLVRRWVVNKLARDSDAAITTNWEDYESLRPVLPTPPALIPIGSNIAPHLPAEYERDAWRARWGAGPGDLLLCFFGFVNARKGVETLLRAVRLLASDPRRSVHPLLLMIGGQTGSSDPTNVSYLARIQGLIAELGLAERVRWTGFIPPEQVSASFACADMCVLPFRDGASFLHGTFHAALAHGVAIITTRPHLPLPELRHGENVFLVASEDEEALAQAIVHLAANQELRHSLGRGAGALAEQFRWDKIAAQTLELYRSIGVSKGIQEGTEGRAEMP